MRDWYTWCVFFAVNNITLFRGLKCAIGPFRAFLLPCVSGARFVLTFICAHNLTLGSLVVSFRSSEARKRINLTNRAHSITRRGERRKIADKPHVHDFVGQKILSKKKSRETGLLINYKSRCVWWKTDEKLSIDKTQARHTAEPEKNAIYVEEMLSPSTFSPSCTL